MIRTALRSLRVRFAVVAFVAIYLPVLVLLGVVLVVDQRVDVIAEGPVEVEEVTVTGRRSPVAVPVAVLLAPAAAGLAWWLSGRAIRPIEAAVAVQGRLIEEASHELRTPLAVLTANAQVLLDHPEPSLELYRTGLERSEAAAERMTRTIDALLADARSRSRAITRTPTDIGQLVAAAVNDLGPAADAGGVAVEVSTREATSSTATSSTAVDEVAVRRAVDNLVTNAIEHAPRGSVVAVDVGLDDDGLVVIAVTDRGPGVPEEDQERIFDRFWSRRPDGTGLGLAVVRQVAEAHGGSVAVVSPVDGSGGARFVLRLR